MRVFFFVIAAVVFLWESRSSERGFKSLTGIDPVAFRRTASQAQRLSWRVFQIVSAGYALLFLRFLIGPSTLLRNPIVSILNHSWFAVLGFAISLSGIYLARSARSRMGRSWRIGFDESETTDLVKDGPFAYIRNPVFAGIMLFQFGLVLIVPHWLNLLLASVASLSFAYQARLEEEHLTIQHGESYRAYARRTGRFCPGIGKYNN
ncbi:isoprenylcysteine carboxylmethyltransferase family protein [bacterium]|nr:isoprenylcysteine carboxylmethyltransferase family protein [bacterium]